MVVIWIKSALNIDSRRQFCSTWKSWYVHVSADLSVLSVDSAATNLSAETPCTPDPPTAVVQRNINRSLGCKIWRSSFGSVWSDYYDLRRQFELYESVSDWPIDRRPAGRWQVVDYKSRVKNSELLSCWMYFHSTHAVVCWSLRSTAVVHELTGKPVK
jgi:hypothetical protein